MTDTDNRSPLINKQIENKISSIGNHYQQQKNKTQIINKFSEKIFRAVIHTIFFSLILITVCYSFSMLTLNYLNSMQNFEIQSAKSLISKPNNQFSFRLLQFSNFSIIYHSQINSYIQDFILIGLMISMLIIWVFIQSWLKYIQESYKNSISQIQNYSLQITVKNKVRKKQLSQFSQYFQNFTSKCLKEKINEISLKELKTTEDQYNYTFLSQILSKLTLIQDVVFIPYRSNHIPQDIFDLRQQESNILIVVFSFQQISSVVLQWYRNSTNAKSVLTYIDNVIQAPSPKNLLFKKLKNQQNYSNKVNQHTKYVYLTILWQFLFIIILAGLIFLHLQPEFIFTIDFKQNYSIIWHHGLLVLEALIMLLQVKFFHQNFIPQILVKSYPIIITFQKQSKRYINLSLFLLIFNLILVPTISYLLANFYEQNFNIINIKCIIQRSFFGQYGLSNLFVYYSILKHIIIAVIQSFGRSLKRCIQSNEQNQQDLYRKGQQITVLCSFFFQLIILMSWTIICNPIIGFAVLVGLLLKLESFCSRKEFVKPCLITLTQFINYFFSVINFVLIILSCSIPNTLLKGYILILDQEQPFYPLIISVGASFIILMLAIILQKLNLQTFSKCPWLIFETFPTQLISKIEDFTLIKQKKQHDNHLTKQQNQMAEKIIKKIFGNQYFLFSYQDEIRQKHLFLQNQAFKLIKKDETRKVAEELNTMSRSLQATLKQRLLTVSTNPFQISPISKDQQAQFDQIPYEDKVKMKPPKRKNIYIPMLFLPVNPFHKKLENKNHVGLYKRTFTDELQKKKAQAKRAKVKGPYESYNLANNGTYSWIGGNNQQLSDIEYNIIDQKEQRSIKQNQYKKQLKEGKNNQQIADQLLKRKVKFTDLFDSEEQSIKNLVKKKIKQSIKKLQY